MPTSRRLASLIATAASGSARPILVAFALAAALLPAGCLVARTPGVHTYPAGRTVVLANGVRLVVPPGSYCRVDRGQIFLQDPSLVELAEIVDLGQRRATATLFVTKPGTAPDDRWREAVLATSSVLAKVSPPYSDAVYVRLKPAFAARSLVPVSVHYVFAGRLQLEVQTSFPVSSSWGRLAARGPEEALRAVEESLHLSLGQSGE